jgi:L-iditol 2-dehydrogenase
MRQIQYTRPGLTMADVSEPQITSPTQVKIRIAYASLCGTDLHIVRGDFDAMIDKSSIPMGHEASGIIVDIGDAATRKGLSVGDRVTFYFNHYCGTCLSCRDGREQFCDGILPTMDFMSDMIVLDEQQVYALPKNIDMAAASLIEPASVAMRGLEMCRIRQGSTVAVSGGGGLGQIVATLAKLAGATSLTMIEPVAEKRALALRRGADHVIDPFNEDVVSTALEITGGRGFDTVIEVSGAPKACMTAMDIAARGACVELLATYAPDATMTMSLANSFLREVTLVTGVAMSPYVLPRSVAIAPQLALGELITTFAPEQYEEGFAAQRDGDSVKTVFTFHGDGA